jgi:hypothetical protein
MRSARNAPLEQQRGAQGVENPALYWYFVSGLSLEAKTILYQVWTCRQARAPCQLRLNEWARLLSRSRRWVIYALLKLEAQRWITIARRGAQWANLYDLGPRGRVVAERIARKRTGRAVRA